MKEYFKKLDKDAKQIYQVAVQARKKGIDPTRTVEITLAKNMAERVIGMISIVAPEIKNSKATERIIDLEKEHGILDWKVALLIAKEVAQEKFCKFKSKKEAIEIGIRTGFSYVTVGVVSSPLEGFTGLEIKKRRDNKGEYFCLNYAGPIRNAGGTAAAVSAIIADYIRKELGYSEYDPTEKEIKRCYTEITDYHERITNLQYFPSQKETEFLMSNLPIEISGDESEKFEVSNYKDLPRIRQNRLRSGYCLMHSSCIPLKAPKLWKQLNDWGKEFNMTHWNFLEEFIKIQKDSQAKGEEKKEKISPNHTYIKDIVAGRPVIGYPMRPGGFRLRYGRGRFSGFSAQAIHPATMQVLGNFVATATQLKVERPGKAAAITVCDSIDGPIVKLKNGSVKFLETEKIAKEYKKEIKEILFLGDILINYGDFLNRAHALVPPGYCPEWWILEFEKKIINLFGNLDYEKTSEIVNIDEESLKILFQKPLKTKISPKAALRISSTMNIPLHPRYTRYWTLINLTELKNLVGWLLTGKQEDGKIILNNSEDKKILEKIGLPHNLINKEKIIIEKNQTLTILATLGCLEFEDLETTLKKLKKEQEDNILKIINKLSLIEIRDKAGVFIGSRMGRPEKSKMRKMTGSPHSLFPVGEAGGRLRSFQAALEKGQIKTPISIFNCKKCDEKTVYSSCPECNNETERIYFCSSCGEINEKKCKIHGTTTPYKIIDVDIKKHFKQTLKLLGEKVYPDLIKGVRGTTNEEHIPEHLSKGILRAKHNIYVNKDGTTRYDCSEVPITHFKPKELFVPIEKLKKLGYKKDINGKELVQNNQILELKPQDIILPCPTNTIDEPGDEVLFRTTKFLDELLVKAYKMKPYYNLKTKEDLVGHYVIGLAPHTSAGTLARIIGFSRTQGLFAHPLLHAAMRRDCFTYESRIPIKKGNNWRLRKIGSVVEELNPTQIVDSFETKEIKVNNYKTLGIVDGKVEEVDINNFTKHKPQKTIQIKTNLGREIETTEEHKHITKNNKIIKARNLKKGYLLKIPYKIKIKKKNIKKIDLIDLFKEEDWGMVQGLKKEVSDFKKILKQYTHKNTHNYYSRDSTPIKIASKIIKKYKLDKTKLTISAKRDKIKLNPIIKVNKKFLNMLGLYVAEGFSRCKRTGKGYYQVYISAEKKEIRRFIKNHFKTLGLKPTERKTDRITFSSRLLYELFINKLKMGSNAHEKRMPQQFLNATNKQIGHLLSGYLEGDGSVSKTDLRICFDTVSKGLLKDIDFLFAQLHIFVKNKTYTKQPGQKLKDFYLKKNKQIPEFTITKGIIQSKFVKKASKYIVFLSRKKQNILNYLVRNKTFRNLFLEYDDEFFFDEIISVKTGRKKPSYCLNVPGNKVVVNNILTKQCDGDESCVLLLLDAFLNFSQKYLPKKRGSTMDAPIVLTSALNPAEVDDMVFDMDIATNYNLNFYKACKEYKMPWDVKVDKVGDHLDDEKKYKNYGFTHPTDNINDGVLCSVYKTLPTMEEKLKGQMELAEKIRAVDTSGVAKLVIEKHFIKDIRGNLRKFSQQQFRCVKCNEKFRRPPLSGICTNCTGKIIFTISEGSVIKYLEPSLSLAKNYELDDYIMQTLNLTKQMIEEVFGKDKEKQAGLGDWFA